MEIESPEWARAPRGHLKGKALALIRPREL